MNEAELLIIIGRQVVEINRLLVAKAKLEAELKALKGNNG